MLRLDADSRESEATDPDVLRELEVRYPQIYTRRKERKARQEALKLSKNLTNHSPRVHFDDENDKSIRRDVQVRRHSECIMGNKSKMDEPEVQRKVNGVEPSDWKSPYQRRNTSPAIDRPQNSKSDALKERLKSNAERLNVLLYQQSPFSGKDGSSTARENGHVKWNGIDHGDRKSEFEQSRRRSEGSLQILTNIQNGHTSMKDPSDNVLCQRIFENPDKSERERNSDYIFNSKFRSSDITETSKLHDDQMTQLTVMSPLQSPESQADSAIDMESVSVQSEVSEFRNGGGSSELTSDNLPSCYTAESDGLASERENSELGFKQHSKDKDVRNRPLTSLPNFVGDLAIRSLQSLHTDKDQGSSDECSSPRSTGTPKSSSPIVSPCRARLQGQTTLRKSGPMKGDHSLYSSTSSIGHIDRELEDIQRRALTSANGTLPSQRSVALDDMVDDTLDDSLDDTDPSLQTPSAPYAEKVITERYWRGKKHVYRVTKRSTSPLFGRATPVKTSDKTDSDVQSDRSILLDMRFNNSFDQSKYVSYVTENAWTGRQQDTDSLKSKSLNDIFQNDDQKKLHLLLENGHQHYKSELMLNDTYSSSTDYPLYGDEHYAINDNFTLSPRSNTEDQMTITMDNIGESKTEDLLSDDSKDVSSLDCSSLSEQSPVFSKVKPISDHKESPKTYVSEITVFPKSFPNEKGIMKTAKDEHSEIQNAGCSRESSLTSDSDPSVSPRVNHTDTEFFMEAEFLDAAMKPKKSRFQKLFGGKKGRYSPAAEDMPPLSTFGPRNHRLRNQAVGTAAPDAVLDQEHCNPSQSFKEEITNTGHLTEHSTNYKEVRAQRTVKDVRFSVAENPDNTCIESFRGNLLREGGITPWKSSVIRDRNEPVINGEGKDGVYLAGPVVVSSGRGPCLDLSVSNDNMPQLDTPSDQDMSKVSMSEFSTQTDQSTRYTFDRGTSSEPPLNVHDTNDTISQTADTESPFSSVSHKNDVNVILGSTISHTTDSDLMHDNTATNTTDHDVSYFSEGFDQHETFDERFECSLSVSDSDNLNNSLSARSAWSECKDLTEAENSFEDDFDGSFTPRSNENKEVSYQYNEESELKEEKEKSSGYGSENSRQTSETKDEPFGDEEKANHGKAVVPRNSSVDLNDEDVDRIFQMAKDPPTFADVDDSLSFEELSVDFSAVHDSEGMEDIVEGTEPVAFQGNSALSVKSKCDDPLKSDEICELAVPKPQLSAQSPCLSKTKVSGLCKESQMASSICSDDVEASADAVSTASNQYESDEMGMSSESEAIRSAFDFLSSSSEVEALTSARDRLRMLKEEDSEEDEDLASSIKILSDLRRSIFSENEDILFEQGFNQEEVSEAEREDSKPVSPPTISEDDDSSFQVDPKPAGVHVEIMADIHHPNVDDSDNGSEVDAPLDVLDEETMVEAGVLLLPEKHHDDHDDDDATTPRPMEDDLDTSVNPLNKTFTVSADRCGDDVSIKSSNLVTSGGRECSSLADELKLPLWEKFHDLSSSERSTPRLNESSTMDDSIPDSSFDVSNMSVELKSDYKDVKKGIPSVSQGTVRNPEPQIEKIDIPEMDEDGSLGFIKETYSERSSGGISQRYIKKSEMDKKRAFLRRQKDVDKDEMIDEGEIIEDEDLRECVREDVCKDELTCHTPNHGQTIHQSGNNFKDLFDNSVAVFDGAKQTDPVEPDVSECTKSSDAESAGAVRLENSANSADLSPRYLTQSDLPEAEVSLSEEMDVSGSSGEVWFDDLNGKNFNETKGSVTSVLSPRADAYRKESESCDSVKSNDSAPPTDFRENKYNLPDVVQSQGLQRTSDNYSENQVKVKSSRKDNPYARISTDGSFSDDSLKEDEESFDLSLNSFISPYATTKSLAKISSTPKNLYKSKAAELSCDGIEPVYDPYATIDTPGGDNSDRRKSGGSEINPYATLNDVTSGELNDGVLHSSKDVLVEASGELSAQSSVNVCDRRTHGSMIIPEIRIEAPTEDEAEGEDSKTGKCIDDLYAKVMKDRSKGDDPDSSKEETNLNSPTSQSSKGGNSNTSQSEDELLGACGGCEELLDTSVEGPPLPTRRYERSISSESTLRSSKALSASKSSLFTNFKDSARVRFQTMRKAMSMDRGLDEVNHDEKNKLGKKEKGEKVKEKNKGDKEKKEKKKKSDSKMKKAPSLKSLSSLFGRKNRDRLSSVEGETDENIDEPVKKGKKERGFFKSKKKRQISSPVNTVDVPTHFRCIGKLKEVNPDGSQIIELSKPPDGPIGFYIAKGTVNYDYGIFVSRFTDDQQKLFAGILGVGDEILEVNDQSVQDKSLDDVYALMAETDKPIMKVFPIVARKEV